MIASSFFPSQPWVERLGWTLLHFLWQGVLIAKVFAAARSLGGRSLGPRSRYRLACASLAVMTLAPLATYWLIGTGSPLIPADESGWSARPFAAAYSVVARGAVNGWRAPREVFPWIVTAWLCGVMAFSIRLAGGWALAGRMRSMRTARPAPPVWQRRLDRLIARIGVSRPVRLLVSSVAQAPLAIGWLRPVILMPVGALTGLPIEQVEALLSHELAHIRRNDYLVNLLQGVAEALLFYHPSVWWVSNEIRAERELCCDDVAVAVSGDAFTYATALAAIESARPERLRTAMAANGGSLANRIRRLLDPSQSVPYAQPSPGAAVTLAVLLLAGIGAAAMDRNEDRIGRVRFGNFEFRTWSAVEGEPVLHAIEFRGMTPEFAREVQSRLPIRIGERVSHTRREQIGSTIGEYDRRLEFGLFPDRKGGAVLRVHPPGLAGAELVPMEPNR